jgi:hypothetical protein
VEIDEYDAEWQAKREAVEIAGREAMLAELIEELVEKRPLSSKKYSRTMQKYVSSGLPWLSKSQVLQAYQELCEAGYPGL